MHRKRLTLVHFMHPTCRNPKNTVANMSILRALLLTLCAVACGTPAVATDGVVATVHPLATDAGVRALQRGGNAVDAAVAAALTLGVAQAVGRSADGKKLSGVHDPRVRGKVGGVAGQR